MNMILEKFDTKLPLPSILSENWKTQMKGSDIVIFNNLDHFIYTVSKLKQKEDSKCGMSYDTALKMLIKKETDFLKEDQKLVRNKVRENLYKRGLITQEIYENFRYTTDGTQVDVDVGKYTAGEADCVLTPARHYIDFFYELYISISYHHGISNKTVRDNVAKILATVEELERQHIFIKINVVLPINQPSNDSKSKFFSIIPLFSHKSFKSVDVMSSVINDRLLRKFYFAIIEELYGEDLNYCYGYPINLEKTLNIGSSINEVDLFENIVKTVGA